MCFSTCLYSENFQVEMSLPDPGATIFSIDVFALFGNACLTFIGRFETLHFKMILRKSGGELYIKYSSIASCLVALHSFW